MTGIDGIPRSIGLIQPAFLFLLIATSRWLVKKWLGTDFSNKINDDNKIRILIYGSGKAGQQLASSLSLSNEFKLISFIDDNKSFWSGTIDGYSVNPPSSISNLIKSKGVKQLWLAIPNLSGKRRQKLINSLRQYPCARKNTSNHF